jgi:hypothetical protein
MTDDIDGDMIRVSAQAYFTLQDMQRLHNDHLGLQERVTTGETLEKVLLWYATVTRTAWELRYSPPSQRSWEPYTRQLGIDPLPTSLALAPDTKVLRIGRGVRRRLALLDQLDPGAAVLALDQLVRLFVEHRLREEDEWHVELIEPPAPSVVADR